MKIAITLFLVSTLNLASISMLEADLTIGFYNKTGQPLNFRVREGQRDNAQIIIIETIEIDQIIPFKVSGIKPLRIRIWPLGHALEQSYTICYYNQISQRGIELVPNVLAPHLDSNNVLVIAITKLDTELELTHTDKNKSEEILSLYALSQEAKNKPTQNTLHRAINEYHQLVKLLLKKGIQPNNDHLTDAQNSRNQAIARLLIGHLRITSDIGIGEGTYGPISKHGISGIYGLPSELAAYIATFMHE